MGAISQAVDERACFRGVEVDIVELGDRELYDGVPMRLTSGFYPKDHSYIMKFMADDFVNTVTGQPGPIVFMIGDLQLDADGNYWAQAVVTSGIILTEREQWDQKRQAYVMECTQNARL